MSTATPSTALPPRKSLDTFEFAPSRFAWRYLNQDAAAALWAELIDWVGWLRGVYGSLNHDIPPCWFRHPELVEELTALMSAHKAAYQVREEEKYWSDMTYWHRQYLRPFISQVKHMYDSSECRDGHCGYRPPRVDSLDSMSEFVGADVASRPAVSAKPPSTSAEPTMTMAQMQQAQQDTEIVPLDPADPFSDVEIDGAIWFFDNTSNVFCRRPDSSDTPPSRR